MEKRKSKLLILSTTALLGLATAGALIATNSQSLFSSGNALISAADVEENIALTSENGVSSSGEKAYDGVSEGAEGAIRITYAGVKEQGASLHVTLNSEGSIAIPVNRMTKLVIRATGSFVLEYGESSSIAGGKEEFEMEGATKTVTFPAEVNFAKLTASSELAIESIGIMYMVNGDCTAKADDTYENGLLNGNDVYYGSGTVSFAGDEYSHKVRLFDFSRLELTLFKDGEGDLVFYFMYTGTENNVVTFEDSDGNSVSLNGSGLLEKTATINLLGEGINASYTKLQKLSSFNLDDFGSYDIVVGEEFEIHAINFSPSNATFKDVTWTTTNESVASVAGLGENFATGAVSILSSGSATIGAYVVNDPEEGTQVTANRTVTFNAFNGIALPAAFEGNNWKSSFSNPDFELAIDGDDIILQDNENSNADVSLHVAYKSGSTYYLADDNGLYLMGASVSNGQITIAAGYTVNGEKHAGSGTITFSKEEAISSVKATIKGVEYASAGSAYQMIAGNDSGYITFTRTGGNYFDDLGAEVVITDDPLAGVPEPTPEPATLLGTWSDGTYTVVVSNDEQSITVSGGVEFEEPVAASWDSEEKCYIGGESDEYWFYFDVIEGGKVDFSETYSTYIFTTLTKEGYTPVEPRKDVFTYSGGYITANREGAGYVKYSWRDNADGGAIKSAYLYVEIAEAVKVASVVLSSNPASGEVAINDDITINAAITPTSVGDINSAKISWSITDDDGKVTKQNSDDTSCVLRGTKAGSVTVTWSDSVSGVSESIVITVTDEEADVVPANMQGTWLGVDDACECDIEIVINNDGTIVVTDGWEAYCNGEVFTLTDKSGDDYTFDSEDYSLVLTFNESYGQLFVTGDIGGVLYFEDTEFTQYVEEAHD